MAIALAALVILIALPGLLFRRLADLKTRGATLVALLAVAVGILDLPATHTQELPPDVAVVPTLTLPGAIGAAETVPQRLGEVVGPEGRVRVFGDRGDLQTRLFAARLASAPEPDVVILWNGPWQGSPKAPAAGADTWALLPPARPPLDPEQVQVRLAGPWAAGRPGRLFLDVGPAPADLRFEVSLTAPGDPTILRYTEREAVHATPASPFELQLQPRLPGPHLLRVTITTQGYTVTGRGTLPVGSATAVQVVGFEAPQLARALEVQGLRAAAHDRLPEDLADVVVLLEPVDPESQARLLRFVDDGGGLLVVGAKGGGAVPREGEPLHQILPVRRLPDAVPPAGPKPGPGPNRPEEEPKPEPKREPEPEREEPPGKDKPTGKVPPVKAPRRPEEKEVDRRSIAMVFLIDRSYSMRTEVSGGRTRMDFAKRATVDAARQLRHGDLVGVVSFGNQGRGKVEVPLTDAAEWQRIQRDVTGLRSQFEGTYAADALRKATELLKRSGRAVRHMVVITDGEIEDTTDVGLFRALKAAEAARRAGCTVSVVQVVPQRLPAGADPVDSAPAKALSDAGGGILARGGSADVIPVVVSTEVRRTMKRAEQDPEGKPERGPEGESEREPDRQPRKEPESAPEKQPQREPEKQPEREPRREPDEDRTPEPRRLEVRAVQDSQLLEPRPDSGYPDLFGILPVRGRPEAQVLLVAGREGVPVLAFANRGLGRVGVWTADLLGNWGREWRQAEPFPAWLAQWVQHLAPALPEPPPQLLQERKITPVAPAPAEVAALGRTTGGRVGEVSEYPGPGKRSQVRVRRQAPDHALFGLAALLVLLMVEFLGRLRLRKGEAG